jgi:hypothetical protein
MVTHSRRCRSGSPRSGLSWGTSLDAVSGVDLDAVQGRGLTHDAIFLMI